MLVVDVKRGHHWISFPVNRQGIGSTIIPTIAMAQAREMVHPMEKRNLGYTTIEASRYTTSKTNEPLIPLERKTYFGSNI